LRADRGGRRLKALSIGVEQGKPCLLLRKAQRNGASDAVRGAGHHDHPILHASHQPDPYCNSPRLQRNYNAVIQPIGSGPLAQSLQRSGTRFKQ
jgi:hypothetical protein